LAELAGPRSAGDVLRQVQGQRVHGRPGLAAGRVPLPAADGLRDGRAPDRGPLAEEPPVVRAGNLLALACLVAPRVCSARRGEACSLSPVSHWVCCPAAGARARSLSLPRLHAVVRSAHNACMLWCAAYILLEGPQAELTAGRLLRGAGWAWCGSMRRRSSTTSRSPRCSPALACLVL